MNDEALYTVRCRHRSRRDAYFDLANIQADSRKVALDDARTIVTHDLQLLADEWRYSIVRKQPLTIIKESHGTP